MVVSEQREEREARAWRVERREGRRWRRRGWWWSAEAAAAIACRGSAWTAGARAAHVPLVQDAAGAGGGDGGGQRADLGRRRVARFGGDRELFFSSSFCLLLFVVATANVVELLRWVFELNCMYEKDESFFLFLFFVLLFFISL